MARDRKRAKQRQQRRAQKSGSDKPEQRSDESAKDEKADTGAPSPLEHSSAEVDEVEESLRAGAAGSSVLPSLGDAPPSQAELEQSPGAKQEIYPDELEGIEDEDEQGKPLPGAKPRKQAPRGVFRFFAFLRASWQELKRVQWPDRRQTAEATAVTLGFVVVAGTYLGVLDWVWQRVIDIII